MKRLFFLISSCLLLATAAVKSGASNVYIGQEPQPDQEPEERLRSIGFRSREAKMVIANRLSGTISVIDVGSDQVIGTYALPAGSKTPEPMYVVYAAGRVFVGDRANNQVAVFNPRTFAVETTVPAGAGIWHMWADPFDRQLWVTNDIDKSCTVIDPTNLQVLATIPIPADLAAAGGRPHDVSLDPVDGNSAYVTLIGVAGAADYVVKFSTQSYTETGRAAVGKDPHVSLTPQNNLLYLPCQNSNVLMVLNRETLEHITSLTIPGAHGAGMADDGNTFYTTNLPGGGGDGLWAVNTGSNTIIGEAVDTPFPAPHNIALTPERGVFPPSRIHRKLYLTHSGATANKVTVYKLKGATPVLHKEVTVGFNPFGLAFVP